MKSARAGPTHILFQIISVPHIDQVIWQNGKRTSNTNLHPMSSQCCWDYLCFLGTLLQQVYQLSHWSYTWHHPALIYWNWQLESHAPCWCRWCEGDTTTIHNFCRSGILPEVLDSRQNPQSAPLHISTITAHYTLHRDWGTHLKHDPFC